MVHNVQIRFDLGFCLQSGRPVLMTDAVDTINVEVNIS
jgi:hypothetical protein